MKKQAELIGIDPEKASALGQKLNVLLASYQVFYQNLRGYHWNIKGPKFFELHLKFEELYTVAQTRIDEIAERILTVGEVPLHSFSDYIATSQISEKKNIQQGTETVSAALGDISILIAMQREILDISAEAGDEGTNALASDYIRADEKTIWMLHSFLS